MFAIEMAIFGSEVFFLQTLIASLVNIFRVFKTILNLKFFLGVAGNVD